MVNIKRSKIYLVIILLLIITLVGLIFSRVRYKNNQINEVVILEGENENWKLNDYKVLIYNNYVRLGDGEVIFIGDNGKVEDLKHFEIEIVKSKVNSKERDMTLYFWSTSSDTGFSIRNKNISFGKSTHEDIIKYIPEDYETNISKLDNFDFSEGYIVKLKVKFEKISGEKFNDEINLDVISVTNDTMSDVKTKSYSY